VLGGKPIELSQIASELGTSYRAVRRYTGVLVAAGYLERHKTSKGPCSYIVTNSKKFAPARQREQQARPKSGFDPAAIAFPDDLKLTHESWAEWIEHRKQKRNKLTQMAVTKQFKNLLDYQRQGHAAKDVIEHSIAQGYTGLYPPNGKVRPRSAPSPGGGLIENLRQQQIASGIREAK
jgi:predicted ArsR family transcriptional regulator